MPADDPMLPHPADANAPMISGRGTKIMADARGAYLAGNLRVLVEAMHDMQKAAFRSVLITQLFYYLEHNLPDEFQDNVELIRAYLDTDTPPFNVFFEQTLERLRDIEALEFEGTFGDYSRFEVGHPLAHVFIDLALALGETNRDLAAMIRSALSTIRWHEEEFQMRSKTELESDIIWSWQIEAAWAILHGRQPPDLNNYVDPQPSLIRAYRRRDLEGLIQHLSASQQASLCTLFIRQALLCAYTMASAQPDEAVISSLLSFRDQWERDCQRVGLSNAQLNVLENLHNLKRSKNFHMGVSQLTIMLSAKRLSHVVTCTINGLSEMLSSGSRYPENPVISSLRSWQFNVIWAVLQGNDPPPFELPQ